MKLNLYLDRTTGDETYIVLLISLNGFSLKTSTGVKIFPKYCEMAGVAKIKKIKNSYSLCRESNIEIDKLKNFITNFITLHNGDNSVTKEQLKKAIDSFKKPHKHLMEEANKQKNIYDLYNEFIEKRANKEEVQVGSLKYYAHKTIQRYRTVHKWLNRFEQEKKFVLTNQTFQTQEFFDKFSKFLAFNNLHRNTIQSMIKTLIAFGHWCQDKKYYPTYSFRSWAIRSEETPLFALTEENLFDITNIVLEEDSYLDNVRYIFLVQCYTGLRFSDITKLSKRNIDLTNRIITLTTSKTEASVSIPITERLFKILTNRTKMNFRSISIQKYNKYLKILAQKINLQGTTEVFTFINGQRVVTDVPIAELLSSHCARRTFITNALRKGISERLIMKVTGHKSLKSFEKYIKLTDDEAHKAFLNAFKE